MLIDKIIIDGFRNLNNVSLELNNVTSLVGLNNFGKTNVLDGIKFGYDFIRYPAKARQILTNNKDRIPINKEISSRNYYFEQEFRFPFNELEYIVNYAFSFEWAKNETIGSKIIFEQLKIKENKPKKQFSTIISRKDGKCFYKSSKTGRCDTPLNVTDLQISIDKLQHIDDLFYLEIINAIIDVKINLNDFVDATSPFEPFPFEIESDFSFDLENNKGHHIAKIIYQLKENKQDKYELLVNSFCALFPHIEYFEPKEFDLETQVNQNFNENAQFKISDKIYRIQVKEKYNNQVTDFSLLSNGTKRIFILLTAAITSELRNTSLIAFEELENCIHPNLFQKLLQLLTALIQNCRIIITSHSPFMLQYLELNKMYIGLPNTNGCASFKRIRKKYHNKIINDAYDEGITLGNYIFDLLVDFADDSELTKYFEE